MTFQLDLNDAIGTICVTVIVILWMRWMMREDDHDHSP